MNKQIKGRDEERSKKIRRKNITFISPKGRERKGEGNESSRRSRLTFDLELQVALTPRSLRHQKTRKESSKRPLEYVKKQKVEKRMNTDEWTSLWLAHSHTFTPTTITRRNRERGKHKKTGSHPSPHACTQILTEATRHHTLMLAELPLPFPTLKFHPYPFHKHWKPLLSPCGHSTMTNVRRGL